MRLALLAILPVMLAACDGGPVDPDARAPVPRPEGTDGSVTLPTVNEFAVTSLEPSPSDGAWSPTRFGRNEALVFADSDENRIAAVSCRVGDGDQRNVIVLHRFISLEDAGESIDIYTSAGARSYGVAGDDHVTATVNPNSPFAIMLGAAKGDIRIVTGNPDAPDVVTFPTSAEVRALVADCRGVDFSSPDQETPEEE